MNNKRVTFSLIALYLLPWGIQYLINNFMSVYVASLPFATDKTVGEVIGLGAVITCISQMVWSYCAGKAKNKSNTLFLSLILLAAISLLFINPGMSKPMLYLYVVLFYGCYMAHQPIIDTICSEVYTKTKYGFGFFRSFASLGYGLAGVVLMLLPHDEPTQFFLYCAILAAASAVFSKMVRAPRVESVTEEKNKNIFNAKYIKFLIYTFVLYIGCTGITSFFAVYFTSPVGLNGDLGIFSLILGIGAIVEWLVVLVYSRYAQRIRARYTFMTIAIAGIFRSFVIYIAPGPGVAALSMLFSCIWYGLLWSTVTPYIQKIVPPDANAFAQGIWTVVSFGAGTFCGGYLSGVYADTFGQQSLFLALAILMAVLAVLTPVLIEE